MSTNRIKFDNTARDFTAYCEDDTGKTEIGPSKFDDANDRFDINCDSTDFQTKYNDATNKFEARSVDINCCCPFPGCVSGNCCGVDEVLMPDKFLIEPHDIFGAGLCDPGEIINGNSYVASGITGCKWHTGNIWDADCPSGGGRISIFMQICYDCMAGEWNIEICDTWQGVVIFCGHWTPGQANRCDDFPRTGVSNSLDLSLPFGQRDPDGCQTADSCSQCCYADNGTVDISIV